jgi:Tol biopolymer transport system component
MKAGDKLGPYEILSAVGAGGMGEVFKARDTRLGRDVAIKISQEKFSDRFEREAKSIAALNHPNICQLYDVGPDYLVMELIDGESPQGPMPLDQALKLAHQIADALEAAHLRGIIHRDLKPANIKVTADGVVKVLDFGLAKMAEAGDPGTRPENSPTLTLNQASRVGMILGTAAYMSPEQARGKNVDKRADIWAFGVVVYEMVTGRKLFDGEDVSEILAKVIQSEPRWDGVPVQVQRLLKKCLEKDPKRRLRDIGDAWELLDSTTLAAPRHSIAPWLVAGVVTLALAALAFVHFREQPPTPELTRFQIPLPANLTFLESFGPEEISPDGRKLAFGAVDAAGVPRLWVRSFDSLEARVLPGIEIVRTPLPFFWSDDSRFLAFLSADRRLKKVDASGGPAQTICEAPDLNGGSWSRDGTILFGGLGMGVMRVSAAGGKPTPLTALSRQDRGHTTPKMLPDGRHFLYYRFSRTLENGAIFVGAMDLKPSEQTSQPLLLNESGPEYFVPSANSSTGHLLFYREGAVLAQPFDAAKVELSGDPVLVVDQVGSNPGIAAYFSASANGVLTYLSGSHAANAQLTWFDREGKNLGTAGEPGGFRALALSRDSKLAVVVRGDPQSGSKANLWLYDFTRGGAATRFTFAAAADISPVFSPDGSRIVFTSNRDGPRSLYQKLTSGVRNEELLLKSDDVDIASGWSPDGHFLLYTHGAAKTKRDVWILPMDGGQKQPMLFQGNEFNEAAAMFSPDGRWIAYESDESGRGEVYVREFSLGADGKPEPTAKHQISTGGGSPLLWREDGKELIWWTQEPRSVVAAEIATKPVFQVSPPKTLFQLPAGVNSSGVTADGKRFLFVVPVAQNGPRQFTVVLNWQAGLKK